ncbi:MAG: phosphoenolpyruvate carboxylase [Rhodanobacteraceae bacterium]|nr:phosphoenolpyruvate carboxylase [Rhodanobacteraceae bacterium]
MTRSVVFEPHDQPLREDVSLLGRLVGEMLSDQLGTSFFQLLEQVRRCAIARREGDPGRLSELSALLGDLQVERALDLVRAFSSYFQLVNLAEQVHRIRRRREHQAADAGPQPGGVMDGLMRLRAAGVGSDAVREALSKLLLEPVFTAHPTEATRRTMLEKEQRIVRALVDRLDSGRTPEEERARLAQMRMHITAAWQTAEYSPVRPSVEQEREHVLFYLTDVLFRAVPACYAEFERCLAATYPELVTGAPLRPLLRFGTWVGGDMDGNPNVGAETIRDALAAHRRVLFARYLGELKELSLILSQSHTRIAIDPAVDARVAAYSKRLRRAWASIPRRHRDMPYRCLLILMAARLGATLEDRDGGYDDPIEFLADLDLIRLSLVRNGGRHAGLYPFQRFVARVNTFGFHLAALDVRQHAEVHRAALSACIAGLEWSAEAAGARRAALHAAIAGDFARPAAAANGTRAVLEVFDALAQSRARYGAAAIGVFIVSMSESADDVLAVLALARIAAGAGAEPLALDVAPLFETVADLSAAPRILRELLADPVYRAHLKARGDRQVVMLGYSDSNKDGGIVASRFALQEAQAELSEIAHGAGIDLSFFHGRGGTASRGGGRTERAVMAAPHGSVNGHLRLTEQGEVIHRKYAIRAIALRNIEQAFSGLLHATLNPAPRDPRESDWRQLMAQIADTSRASYRQLVYGETEFAEYFRAATPIDVIERMKIGSRPSLRKGDSFRIEQLRAIPWVFAWSQSRHGLPGWFGLGSGLAAACARVGEQRMVEMARDWPFFLLMLEDVEMVLAKADVGIAAQYSALAGPLHQRYWPIIEAEWQRTIEYILKLKGSSELLAYDRRLQRTIRLRNPYVDPISVLQVDMLRRWREGERKDEHLFEALVATVNGIARGLQNTG